MRAGARKILVADLLCGAGGSSTGCAQALAELGLEMDLVCVNHWPLAIETHSRNHPLARHFCQDISTVRPHQVVPELRLDLLMASPTCTHHSNARGGKPTSDQQRSDPWHIITWLTELDVERLIIENVWEFRNWGPVDPVTGKPIPERKGEYFRAWIGVLQQLGYRPEWRKLNAADYGDATTRSRFILMARKDRKAVAWPVQTHSRNAEIAGTRRWRPAGDIIDWSIKGKSIFNRPKKLSNATLERVLDGIVRGNWPEPFIVILRNHMAGKSIDQPLPTITGAGNHIWLAEPVILSLQNSGKARSADDPLPTITTGGAGVDKRPGCGRPMLFEPFVLSQASGGVGRPVAEPLPTAVTGGAMALVAPYYGSGSGKTCKSVERPLPTVTSKARFGLVVPITHRDNSRRARDVDTDLLPTITTANRGELALVEGVSQQLHYDILYRMLEPHELAGAMGFDGDDQPYAFAGNKTEKIKQIGNAVSVAKMRACVKALMADLAQSDAVMEAAE